MKVDLAPNRPRIELTLGDGSVGVLSPLVREDRPLLMAGLDEMTVEDRFARFGQGLSRLTDNEWNYLTDIDQRHHVAWVGVINGQGAGVGRYIVEDQGCAEVAVTVLDPYKRRGVGRALLDALSAVARHDGLTRFCFEVLESNQRVLQILRNWSVRLQTRDGIIEGELELGTVKPDDARYVEVMETYRAMAP